jgi:hypothetical protein
MFHEFNRASCLHTICILVAITLYLSQFVLSASPLLLQVEASEMLAQVANFGGKSLDEPDEILRSARGAFDRLDANRDGTLTAAESTTFWRHLGSMLSVSEVGADNLVDSPPSIDMHFS